MRFGLVLPIQATGVEFDEFLDQLRREVHAAEAAGFDAFFFPEFHQTRAGGVVSPLLAGAALAEGTERIRFGPAVLAGPLHHPVRVAEDMAMLSWLTKGRAFLGLGTAHQEPDFSLYGVDRSTRFRRLPEMLDVIEACWSGEAFDISGEFGRWSGRVTPRPHGGVAPEIWIGAHGPRGLDLAGRRGDVWIADPQRDVETVARLAERYRASAFGAGRRPRVALFRDGWVAETRSACEKDWLPHVMAVHRLYFNVGVYHREFEPWVDEIRTKADFTAEVVAPGRFLYGSGAEVRADVEQWAALTGCEYLALRMRHPGGPSHEATLEAIARFGAEVIEKLATPTRTGRQDRP